MMKRNGTIVSPTLDILCIEDAPGEARLIEKHLSREGYTVTLAHNGEAGLILQEKGAFQIVLIDLQLPDITGLEVLQILLTRDALLPVIVVTGHGDEETAVTAMKLGARDYIVKDVHGGFIELLPPVIEQAMRQQRLVLEKQYAEGVSQRREAILEIVAFAAEKLLQTPAWKNHIDEILARLGQAARVSRVYLAENDVPVDGNPGIKQCYEWAAANINYRTLSCIGKPYSDLGLSELMGQFEQGKAVYGLTEEMPAAMQVHLKNHQVTLIILVPIFTGNYWWGFIGFDSCNRKEMWDSAEIDALRTAANILGAALQRQQTEATLYQAQKMESIGLLAGGVAHDFNNLLTGILSQTTLALIKLPPDSPIRENISQAIETTERAALLVRQLLGYAGKGNYLIKPVNLNDLIRENIDLLETVLRKRSDLHLNLAPQLPLVAADRNQMQQIVMNLVMNAAEANERYGREIQIKTEAVTSETPISGAAKSLLPPGKYVCLQIRDNGSGIEPAIQDRIFDPFFSTKAHGRGLGLSAAFGIVQTHGGTLQVESTVGQGSCFRVLLPASEQAAASKPVTHILESTINHCILLIDDEAIVRQTVKDGLESLGADVLLAENGDQGIELYRQKWTEIDLVLLDMQMPGMDGRQTYQHLSQINPRLNVILSSGYSEAEAIQGFSSQQIAGFLPKPYRFEKLVATVQAALTNNNKHIGKNG